MSNSHFLSLARIILTDFLHPNVTATYQKITIETEFE